VAHRPDRVAGLRAKAALVERLFGERWPVWSREELAERLLDAPEAHGCLHVPHYFGLHPLRYARGLAEAAARAGAAVHPRTPVLRWERAAGRRRRHHLLYTPAATVTADRVLVATNGYTPEDLDPALAGRLLPALSSILVTRPLTPTEQAAHRWTEPALLADTRDLLFYIRLLSDRRLLFGARGGTDASPAAFGRRVAWMRRRLGQKFPAWAGVEVGHAWWGLVCLARDLLPHLAWLDGDDRPPGTALCALAYHGGGVAFSTMLGRAAAAVLAGREPDPPLPAFVRTPPPRFPLPRARVWALRGAYAAYNRGDLDGFWQACREDFTFHVPGRSGIAGAFTGRAEFHRLITSVLELAGGRFEEVVEDVLANDHHGVVLTLQRFERYGMPKEYRTAHVYRIQDGKLAEAWEQPRDPETFNEAWS
jgi:glycine/D-amino acid oxidase-like deaminating enzyme/ketosteroid isomerase-like protein